jgi:hypothetical protein
VSGGGARACTLSVGSHCRPSLQGRPAWQTSPLFGGLTHCISSVSHMRVPLQGADWLQGSLMALRGHRGAGGRGGGGWRKPAVCACLHVRPLPNARGRRFPESPPAGRCTQSPPQHGAPGLVDADFEERVALHRRGARHGRVALPHRHGHPAADVGEALEADQLGGAGGIEQPAAGLPKLPAARGGEGARRKRGRGGSPLLGGGQREQGRAERGRGRGAESGRHVLSRPLTAQPSPPPTWGCCGTRPRPCRTPAPPRRAARTRGTSPPPWPAPRSAGR